MNGSFAFGDGFDRGGGGTSSSIRSSRSRLVHPDADQGRSSSASSSRFGGPSDFHHYNGGGMGMGMSMNQSLYGGGDVDPRHYGGRDRDSEYGDDYFGRSPHHYSEDPRYGGRGIPPSRGGGDPYHHHQLHHQRHHHPRAHDKLHDSLLLPEEDSYDDSLDGSSSSLKTPPPSSPPGSPPPQGKDNGNGNGTRPGVQFCSSHDAVSAKIAAFDGNNPAAAPQIEIAPGLMARLRGAKETWEAVENDFYLPTTCFCCQTDLFCIMDANYVLCPTCKVVGPLEGCAQGMEGGVGLGFTYQDLQQWQYEIVVRRQRSGR